MSCSRLSTFQENIPGSLDAIVKTHECELWTPANTKISLPQESRSPRPFARTGEAKYKKTRAVGDRKSSSLDEHFTVTQMHPAINRSSFEFDLGDEKACHRLVHFLAARISTRYNTCLSENLEIIHDGKMTTGLRYMMQVRTEAPTPHTGHGCCKRENLPP